MRGRCLGLSRGERADGRGQSHTGCHLLPDDPRSQEGLAVREVT